MAEFGKVRDAHEAIIRDWLELNEAVEVARIYCECQPPCAEHHEAWIGRCTSIRWAGWLGDQKSFR